MKPSHTALIVIDLQNDYFKGGAYPLWQTEQIKDRIVTAIHAANKIGMPVILIQHIAKAQTGLAPFFNAGSHGAQIHTDITNAAPNAPVLTKHFADSFAQTTLEQTLSDLQIKRLLLCGMMTQNCITHTALSKSAEAYEVEILTDCSTTIDMMIHQIALRAIEPRIPLTLSLDAI
jgi:nicotinamidase-related amidase